MPTVDETLDGLGGSEIRKYGYDARFVEGSVGFAD
jgi:hypothetical protein